MTKNKSMVFLITLIILIIGVSAVNATDISNDTTTQTITDTPNTNQIETQGIIKDTSDDNINVIRESQTKEIKTTQQNIVNNNKNLKKARTVRINDKTYTNYFDDEHIFKNDKLDNNGEIILSGEFNDNTRFTFDNINATIRGENGQTVINNGLITAEENSQLTITNITFNTNNNDYQNVIQLASDNNVIDNVTIDHRVNSSKAQSIFITGSNNTVKNSKIDVAGPSNSVDWSSDPQIAPIVGIILESDDNLVINNNISVTATTSTGWGTVEAITIQAPGTTSMRNNRVNNNNITGKGTDYIYGINLGGNIYNTTLDGNYINITSNTYANGIQFMVSPAANATISNNTIDVTAGKKESQVTYGIILSSWGTGTFENMQVDSNKVYTHGNETYGIEIFSNVYSTTPAVKNITLSNNQILSDGDYSTGIGIMGDGFKIYGNNITMNGKTNNTRDASPDYIKPTTTGITLQKVTNSRVYNNTLTITNGHTIRIIQNSNNIRITENNLKTNSTNTTTYGQGADSIYITSSNLITTYNNTPKSSKISITGALSLYTDSTITIQLTDETGINIDNAQVSVTVDDTTQELTTTNGKATVIYTPSSMNDIQVTAIFNGNTQYLSSKANNTLKITDNRIIPTITQEDITAIIDTPVIITGTITTDNQPIQLNNIILTINNVNTTIRTDNNGRYTYTYNPVTIGTYNIMITTPANIQYKQTTKTAALTVNPHNTITTIEDITATVNTPITITATINDENQNPVQEGYLVFTDNNGNILGNITVTGGIAQINVTYDTEGTYDITANYTGNDKYNPSTTKTTVTIENKITTITIAKVTGKIGDKTELTATVKNGDNLANNGLLVFKVNGRSIRDTNGKVIYANVENGTAKINTTILSTWQNGKITALYIGQDNNQIRSNNYTMDITKPQATIETNINTDNIKTEQTITITTKITANTQTTINGRVIYKINDKTLRDNNGKIIYGQVINGQATINYNIPAYYTPDTYTLTSTYIADNYDNTSTNTTIIIKQ